MFDVVVGRGSGVVDEDVERSEARNHRRHGFAPGLLDRYVELDERRARTEFGGDRLAGGDVDIGEDDGRAFADEGVGGGTADAGCGPRDERDFRFKSSSQGVPSGRAES